MARPLLDRVSMAVVVCAFVEVAYEQEKEMGYHKEEKKNQEKAVRLLKPA